MRTLGRHSGGRGDCRAGRRLHTGVARAGGTILALDEHDSEVVGALNRWAWHRCGGHYWHTLILWEGTDDFFYGCGALNNWLIC